jgi:hypothetical protein
VGGYGGLADEVAREAGDLAPGQVGNDEDTLWPVDAFLDGRSELVEIREDPAVFVWNEQPDRAQPVRNRSATRCFSSGKPSPFKAEIWTAFG